MSRRSNPYSVPGDPRWITARFHSACQCETVIAPGDRAFYWPRGKRLECAQCGDASERRFVAEVQDEVMSDGWS
jgi:hypothetical protein